MVGQEVVMGDWAPVEEGWEAVGEALRGRMAVFRGPKEAGDWARRAGRQGVGAAAGETMEGRRVGAVVGQGAVEVGEEKDPLGAEAKDDLVDTVAAERPGSRGAMVREELAGALVPLAPGPEDAFLVPQAYHLLSRR